ncbi:MAG TPA: NdvB protein, partial [Cellvibrionaceae bacterium]
MTYSTDYGARWNLPSPTLEPKAAGFLWNRHMQVEASCRGLGAKQFKAPEMSMHNRRLGQSVVGDEQIGSFVYIRDEQNGELYSAPYEPVRRHPEMFNFSVGQHDITWDACFDGIDIRIQLSLAADEPLELWSITIANRSPRQRTLSVYPYFSMSQISNTYQCAEYRPDLEGIVAKSISSAPNHNPVKHTHFVLHERTPSAWQVQREAFAGEGGLHNPDALQHDELPCDDARQEAPVAVLQYRATLAPGASETYRLLAGSAENKREIHALRERYLSAAGFARAQVEYKNYLAGAEGIAQIDTPDETINHFVNHWLPRQMFYCADTQRLTENPATDDYLQDQLGMIYLDSECARAKFMAALSQQQSGGAMPETIGNES